MHSSSVSQLGSADFAAATRCPSAESTPASELATNARSDGAFPVFSRSRRDFFPIARRRRSRVPRQSLGMTAD